MASSVSASPKAVAPPAGQQNNQGRGRGGKGNVIQRPVPAKAPETKAPAAAPAASPQTATEIKIQDQW